MLAEKSKIERWPDYLYTLALVVWVAIIVLTGTYLRIRAEDQSMSVDWLVAARLGACLMGGAIGYILMRLNGRIGTSAIILFSFVGAALLSVTFSAYRELVFGYWLLLAGAALLTTGIVYHSTRPADLIKVEKIWLVVMLLILLKDALTALLMPHMQADYGVGGPTRLGMGVTHANALGFGAAITFWLTFRQARRKWLLLTVRFILLAIVLLAWSRTAMLSLAFAGLVRFWFKQGLKGEKYLLFRLAVVLALIGLVIFIGLSLAFDATITREALQAFNRGQDLQTVTSLTGRTEIWPVVVKKIFAGPQYFIFGHGYGVSRLIINEGYLIPAFYASNAHNTFMEILLTMGSFGTVFFVALALYVLMWLLRYRHFATVFGSEFTLRAITTITIILIHANTESVMGTKIGPVTLLFFFYVLALDRAKSFLTLQEKTPPRQSVVKA